MDTGNKMRQTELILLTALWKLSSLAFADALAQGEQITSVTSQKPLTGKERKEEGWTSTVGLEAIVKHKNIHQPLEQLDRQTQVQRERNF